MAKRAPVRVFILEDSVNRVSQFRQLLVGCDVTVASSFDEAVARFRSPYDLLCLDYDLGGAPAASPYDENTGCGFVLWMPDASVDLCPSALVHSHDPSGALEMGRELSAKGFNVKVQPFGDAALEWVRRQIASTTVGGGSDDG